MPAESTTAELTSLSANPLSAVSESDNCSPLVFGFIRSTLAMIFTWISPFCISFRNSCCIANTAVLSCLESICRYLSFKGEELGNKSKYLTRSEPFSKAWFLRFSNCSSTIFLMRLRYAVIRLLLESISLGSIGTKVSSRFSV